MKRLVTVLLFLPTSFGGSILLQTAGMFVKGRASFVVTEEDDVLRVESTLGTSVQDFPLSRVYAWIASDGAIWLLERKPGARGLTLRLLQITAARDGIGTTAWPWVAYASHENAHGVHVLSEAHTTGDNR